ncbi:MAG: hypothetical protein WA705_30365 [Candidatus Ozemobacteraceae bacterium]
MSRFNKMGLFLVLYSAFFTAAAIGQSENIYQDAMNQISAKQFSKGVTTYYKFLLKSDPLSSLESRKKDLASPLEYFRSLCQGNPKGDQPKFFLTLINRIIQNWSTAQTLLDEMRKAHPASLLLRFLDVEFLLGQDFIREALDRFQELGKNPNATKFVTLADFLLKRRGISSDSVIKRIGQLRKAFRHQDLMEWEDAEKTFRQVIHDNPKDREAYGGLLELLVLTKHFEEAQKVLLECKAAVGNAAVTPFQEARILYFLRRFREVITLLSPLIGKENVNEYGVFLLAESEFQTEKFRESCILFETLHANDPDNLGFLLRATACYERLGSPASAAEMLFEEVIRRPEEAILHMELACLYERMGKNADALDEFQRIADLSGPLQMEAEERLTSLSAKIAEEKKRERLQASDQVSARVQENLADNTSSRQQLSEEKPERTEESMFEKFVHQQNETTDRLEHLSN